MELFLVLAVVVWIIASGAKNVKKAQNAQKQAGGTGQGAQNRQAATGARRRSQSNDPRRSSQQAPKQPSPAPYRPITPGGSLGDYTPMQSTEGISTYKPMAPRLSADRQADSIGSLGVGSTEGIDVCDPSLEHGVSAEDLSPVFSYAMPVEGALKFNRRALLQGVIMSEVLTRPSQRKWGRRPHG